MESYGATLKKLIKFTNVKLTTIADIAGYDVSYVSKWCNQSKLPATRVSASINKAFAKIFAEEIMAAGDFDNFCTEFNAKIAPGDLALFINTLLKDTFKNTSEKNEKEYRGKDECKVRVVLGHSEIINYFVYEVGEIVFNSNEPVEILCTMDALAVYEANAQNIEQFCLVPKSPVHIKVGLNMDNLNTKNLLKLYYFINKYHHISFDFYNNVTISERNLIIIKDKLAIMSSLDNRGRLDLISAISDKQTVEVLHSKTAALFKIHHLLIMSMSSKEMFTSGYRSNFYAYNNYQIFLSKGFEYLVPVELSDNIVRAAYEQGYDENIEKVLRKLAFTWDELFINEKSDFFMMKSALLKYLEDGEFYFTDIVYRMSGEERKKHIERVLEMVNQNPDLNFYIIDDEIIPCEYKKTVFSLYSNQNKLFLKNTRSFYDSKGPQFYSILSEPLIATIGDAVRQLSKQQDICSHFDAERINNFMKQYSAMVERIISLSEINNPAKQPYDKNSSRY